MAICHLSPRVAFFLAVSKDCHNPSRFTSCFPFLFLSFSYSLPSSVGTRLMMVQNTYAFNAEPICDWFLFSFFLFFLLFCILCLFLCLFFFLSFFSSISSHECIHSWHFHYIDWKLSCFKYPFNFFFFSLSDHHYIHEKERFFLRNIEYQCENSFTSTV